MSVGGRKSLSVGLAALCALATIMFATATSAFAETPETTAATSITAGTAVLNGVLNPHSKAPAGADWFIYYEAGPKCGREHHTPLEYEEPEVEHQSVHVELTGLRPDTLYTFCLSEERVTGGEVSFTTKAAATPPFGLGSGRVGLGGSGSGELNEPYGVAVDQASGGDVYVGDVNNNRVDAFDAAGGFLDAFGWGVNGAAPANELQTCTTSCREGSGGAGAGALSAAYGLAVDNDPLSASYGDVYVGEPGNQRLQKFDPAGHFLLMFGGGVNETTGADVCVAGEKCQAGASGTADGEFEGSPTSIAVGPGGAVYVGDQARVQVFESSGVWREAISLAGLSSEGVVTALAVDAAGNIFVKIGNEYGHREGAVPGVREFAPNGTEKAQFDAGSMSVQALAVDAAGDLFVGEGGGGFHILEYSPAGVELDSFAAHTVARAQGMAFSESGGSPGELYVSNAQKVQSNPLTVEIPTEGVWALPVPAPGPLVEPGSESATPAPAGAATLEATINPEGVETTYSFQHVDQAAFQASGYAGASSTAPVSVGSSFEDQPASAGLTGLTPSTVYHYRVLATNAKGETTTGPDQTFETLPAVLVEGPWASDVAASSATFAARVNPLGASTEYQLEWGTSTAYGHVFGGNVGEGDAYVPVGGFHIQELEPATTYHYRLVTVSREGTLVGSDHVFTTQLAGEEQALPDGRAWELVSPAKKGGALIRPLNSNTHAIQGTPDGSAIAYEASAAVGEGATGASNDNESLSRRGPGGWRTEDITKLGGLPLEGQPAEATQSNGGLGYTMLSSDLSVGVVGRSPEGHPRPLSSEATEETPYLRNNLVCVAQPQACYAPLVTSKNVEPPTVPFGGKSVGQDGSGFEVHVIGGTPDLSHLVLTSPYALTAGAASGTKLGVEGTEGFVPEQNLYEWDDGRLQLVNVLPDGTTRPGATLGYQTSNGADMAAHTVSSDGRFIVWSYGLNGKIELFVREMVAQRTVKIGGPAANFQTMSSDGSRVFYRENGELSEVNMETGKQTDLTAGHGAGEASAGVRDAVLGASEDGSYVYFVATGVLAGGASAGGDNLYVAHDTVAGWSTTYIATLSGEDESSWYANSLVGGGAPCGCQGVEHNKVSSRVSPNGRYLSFMSDRPLTGYDNRDALSGEPDEEVFLYDAVAKRLVCASCNPTGARPVGVLDGHSRILVDPEDAWGARGEEGANAEGEHRLAGMTPTWENVFNQSVFTSFYQPRFLSNGGRLFFDSPDGLVPQATNGLMNVYEYEPPSTSLEAPPNDSCTTGSATYSERSDGCVSLISGGTSGEESMFYDASESGDDVFFITMSRLVPEDVDAAYDVYDARVCTVEAPCSAAPVTPPPCSSGDSCKAAPSPQPAIFGAPPSATFNGAGNVVPEETKGAVKPKARGARCRKGYVKKRRKCVKKPKRPKRRAGKANGERRAK